jgi:hypothetical protein
LLEHVLVAVSPACFLYFVVGPAVGAVVGFGFVKGFAKIFGVILQIPTPLLRMS